MLLGGTSPDSWTDKLEDEDDSLFAKFNTSLKSLEDKTILSMSHRDSTVENNIVEEHVDVVDLNSWKRYSGIHQNNLQELVQIIGAPNSANDSLKKNDIQAKSIILICSHMKRDKRCGFIGPMLFQEVMESLKTLDLDKDVEVHQTSHFGGHKFAGNMIIYPQGVWYGRVTPCDVKPILEELFLRKRVIKELFRGSLQW